MLRTGSCHPKVKAGQESRLELGVKEEYPVFFYRGGEGGGGKLEIAQREHQSRLGNRWW